MEREMLLTIRGVQHFPEEPPDTTELLTEGTLRLEDGAVYLTYAESELTGMAGTQTTFRVEPARVTLTRTGAVKSRMVFAEGETDRSLYDMGFGALMISVRTDRIETNLGENGGRLKVSYSVSIEDGPAGTVEYRVTARPKKA